MAKPKQESSLDQHILANYSSDAETDSPFLGEDWVIVKKQKVTILIPPLPYPPSEQFQDSVLIKMANTASNLPPEKCSLNQAVKPTRTPCLLRTVNQCKLSKTMKSANLERKVRRAGGLSRWLSSMGLEQFVRVFRSRKVSKFQLANLSMAKLKDMGVNQVGPRRKLMHAIECVCCPDCFALV